MEMARDSQWLIKAAGAGLMVLGLVFIVLPYVDSSLHF